MYGEIRSRWERKGDAMELQVTIPANTTAEIVLPEANLSRVQENGVALDQQELLPGIVSVTQTEEDVVIEAGSGEYRFTW